MLKTPIVPHTLPVAAKLLPVQPNQEAAIRLLEKECSKNLPQCENESPTMLLLRRIRFAALKVSGRWASEIRKKA